MNRVTQAPRFGGTQVALLTAVAVASIAAVAGFRAVFADWSFMTSAVVGAAGAALVIGLAWSRRLLIGETVAASALAFVLVGTVASGGLPTPGAFGTFFGGLINGWAELLSQTPPLDVTAELRVLPFTLAWLGTTVGSELIRRTSASVLSTIGPLITLSVSVLVTAEDRNVGIAQGAVIALVALGVGLIQVVLGSARPTTPSLTASSNAEAGDGPDDQLLDAATGDDDRRSRRRARRRALRAGAALTIVAVAAPMVGPRLPFASAYERFDLRDRNVPPWDPLLVPSPLVQVKSSLKDGARDDVVFTVRADQPIDRFDLAVLGSFDGVVWTVGSADGIDPQTEFRPVGTRLPDRPVELVVPSDRRSATITIGALDGPWLPTTGWPQRLDVDRDVDVRMNLVTGTIAIPAGVRPDLSYEIDVDLEARPTDEALTELPVRPTASTDDDDNAVIPGSIRNIAADILEGVDQGYPRLVALRDAFVQQGFYDTSPQSRPGHSYFRLDEFLEDPDRLVGFEEQYAAAAATISELAGLPTRVVVGYLVPDDRYDDDGVAEVVANDISAWVEVDFGTSGWISIDVTPDRSREPTADTTGRTIQDVAVPSPPPPPEIPPDPEVLSNEEEPEEPDEEDDDEDDEDDEAGDDGALAAGAIVGAAAAGLLLAVVLFFVGIAWWKVRRRARRRRDVDAAAQVGLAWRELLDRYGEVGATPLVRSTPREAMRSVARDPATADATREAEASLPSLVAAVERAAYHPDPPAASDGDDAWAYYDDVADALSRRLSWHERLRMSADPRPVVRRDWNGRDWTRAIDPSPDAVGAPGDTE